MVANLTAGLRGHIIEVARLGYQFSVTHTCNGKLLFTATYKKEEYAIRSAELLGASLIGTEDVNLITRISAYMETG